MAKDLLRPEHWVLYCCNYVENIAEFGKVICKLDLLLQTHCQ